MASSDPTTEYSGTVVVPYGNMLFSRPSYSTIHSRWLTVGVAKPTDIAATDNIEEVPWVWFARTHSAGSSGDLRSVIDYLLVPTFEWFGNNTGSRMYITLREHDERVLRLRNP
jgi:hypothetical protein